MNWSKRTPLLNEAGFLASQQPHIGGFGRQAQAVELYDKLLEIIDLKSGFEVTELKKLDGEAQAFMNVVMNESGKGNWNFRSGIEATMMRYTPTECPLMPETTTNAQQDHMCFT